MHQKPYILSQKHYSCNKNQQINWKEMKICTLKTSKIRYWNFLLINYVERKLCLLSETGPCPPFINNVCDWLVAIKNDHMSK